MLSNLEASAEGQGSPPRFLMMFWPVGTVPWAFRPLGEGFDYQPSSILQPFEDAGLRQETIVLYGLTDEGVQLRGGGGEEGGVVLRTTGTPSPGTRSNGGESDDAVAGGPSFDQIFLENVPQLSPANADLRYVNAIADARVDSQETSSQCLSYSHETRSVLSAYPGGMITEHVPLLPELSPAQLFAKVFSGFMPGGRTDANAREALNALELRKSVLDYSLGALARIKSLAPASESEKIDIHADAIRTIELQITQQIDGNRTPTCQVPTTPSSLLVAPSGSKFDYADPTAPNDESAGLEALGHLHLGVIRAAFQCDLLRVATFQWTSGVDRVAFKGLYPGEPETSYRHHPMSHKIAGTSLEVPPPTGYAADVVTFLANVHTWFNQKTADVVRSFKETRDVFGNSLLDHTVIPFVTATATAYHDRSPLPTLIFGGRALGMQGGQYLNFEKAPRPHNDVWLSIAQALLPDAEDVKRALADELFTQAVSSSAPIAGLWTKP